MRATRLTIASLGVLAGLYGAFELLSTGFANILDAVIWLAGGVVAHDFVFAPLMLLVLGVGLLVVPSRVRAPVSAAAIVLVTVTITAVPVLGRLGARPDNPSLLPRNYVVGWLVLVVLVVLVTVAWVLISRVRRPRR